MKPIYWIVSHEGTETRFTERARARGFVIMCRARGIDAHVKPVFTH